MALNIKDKAYFYAYTTYNIYLWNSERNDAYWHFKSFLFLKNKGKLSKTVEKKTIKKIHDNIKSSFEIEWIILLVYYNV